MSIPTKNLPFTKMQGLGNDFVLVEADALMALFDKPLDRIPLAELAAAVSDRHFGIGSDGLIVVAPPTDPSHDDIQFIFYNSDGSRAEMCGNGIRCFARYVRDRGVISKDAFTVETLAGPIRPRINPDGTVTVDMGAPILTPAKIPFALDQHMPMIQGFPLEVLDTVIPVTLVSMGNPHCVIFQDDLGAPLDPAVFGPVIERHPYFPAKTNVEFVTIQDRQHVDVVVWERGCGFTLACGTGACATAVAAVLNDKTAPHVAVKLPGGILDIEWEHPLSPDDLEESPGSVLMTGPADYVFLGQYPLQ